MTYLKKLPGLSEKQIKELEELGVNGKNIHQFLDKLPREARYEVEHGICRRVPLAAAKKLVKHLQPGLIPVGSVRRGCKFVSDLDLLSTVPLKYVHQVFEYIAGWKLFNLVPLSEGESRRTYIFELGEKLAVPDCSNIRVDLFYSEPEKLPFALLHHTGSREWNIRVRAHAKSQGLMLNQYGLYRDGKLLDEEFPDEKSIIEFIGVTYKEPEKRDF